MSINTESKVRNTDEVAEATNIYYCNSVEQFKELEAEYGNAAKWMNPNWCPADSDAERTAGRKSKIERTQEENRKQHAKNGSRWLCHKLKDDGPLWPGEGFMKGNDVY